MTASCQGRKQRRSQGLLPQSKTRRWELLQGSSPGHPSLLLGSPCVPWAQTLPRTCQNHLSVLRVSVRPRTCQTGRESLTLNRCHPASNRRYLQSSGLLCPRVDRTPCTPAFMPGGWGRCTEAPPSIPAPLPSCQGGGETHRGLSLHPCTPARLGAQGGHLTSRRTHQGVKLHPCFHTRGQAENPQARQGPETG